VRQDELLMIYFFITYQTAKYYGLRRAPKPHFFGLTPWALENFSLIVALRRAVYLFRGSFSPVKQSLL